MIQDSPVVFVVPPNEQLRCPLCLEVFKDPVDTLCGCTFCRCCILEAVGTHDECPIHHTPLSCTAPLHPSKQVQAHIDDLLIYCKGGLQKTGTGEWTLNPTGCKLWLNLGRRTEHEDNCEHVLKAFGGERRHPPVQACSYRSHGCLFVGATEQEVLVHYEQCGYANLLKRVEQLEGQLAARDSEIVKLNARLDAQARVHAEAMALAQVQAQMQPQAPITEPQQTDKNVNEIIQSISRGLDKLGADSTRLFEDAKDTLRQAKTNIMNSTAYRTSLQVLHSIKEVVETARNEFIAKLLELELIAKNKVHRLTRVSRKAIAHTPAATSTATPTSIFQTSLPEVSSTIPQTPNPDLTPNSNPPVISSSTKSFKDQQGVIQQYNFPISTIPSPPSMNLRMSFDDFENDGDDELKEHLEASKREYLKDQEARMAEEESIRQAMRLSLIDFTNSN